jgi:hypothetical protein
VRAPGPPVRFLIAVIGLWIGGRAAMLTWGGQAGGVETERVAGVDAGGRPPDAVAVVASPSALASATAPALLSPAPLRGLAPVALAGSAGMRIGRPGRLPAQGRGAEDVTVLAAIANGRAAEALDSPSAAEPPRGIAAAPASAPVAADPAGRWSGSVFLFARSGSQSGVPLAGGGQLGGSQAGARIAYRLDEAGRIAAAARFYVPADSLRGAEAAVGIDVRPLPDVPFRLSVERRIAIGRDGRDAWSAYAAGGFFRGLGPTLELDGYAQAGVVGAKAGDLFVDGAVRLARRFDIGGNRAVLAGAGAWGAAQPGAARIDAGPRVALRLPAAGTAISIAGEWRARIAGDTRPRSGPALTVAADF